MTVAENVQMALIAHRRRDLRAVAQGKRVPSRARDASFWQQVGMAAAADRACRELAYGDVKRVEFAIALASDPRLLLMDEPTAGMAPRERNELIALVKSIVVERGVSVLFTEHSMDVVFAFADRILVMARGRLIAAGDAKTIRSDPTVRQVYFGSGRISARERTHLMSEPPALAVDQPQRLVRHRAHSVRHELYRRPR